MFTGPVLPQSLNRAPLSVAKSCRFTGKNETERSQSSWMVRLSSGAFMSLTLRESSPTS